MRFRLDEATYVSDRIVPEGLEVGDGPESYDPWKYPDNDPNPALRGKFRPPGRYMMPLDAEAEELFKKTFGENSLANRPDIDPTASIPIGGPKRDAQGNIITEKKPGDPVKPELRPLPSEPKLTIQMRDKK